MAYFYDPTGPNASRRGGEALPGLTEVARRRRAPSRPCGVASSAARLSRGARAEQPELATAWVFADPSGWKCSERYREAEDSRPGGAGQ
jgi:hypothetical protein